MKKIILLVTALILVLSSTVVLASDSKDLKFGVGFEHNFNTMNNISVRSWFGNIGLSGTYGELITDIKNSSNFDTEVRQYDARVMFAPIIKDNGRFFIGGKVGKIESDESGVDIDTILYGAMVGAEFTPEELKNMAIFWNVGYTLTEDDDLDIIDFEIRGTDVTIGMVWYF